MSPKYRPKYGRSSSSDDWLDAPVSRREKIERKPKRESAIALRWDEGNATVIEVFPKQCRVRCDEEPSSIILCTYRRAAIFGAATLPVGPRKLEIRERTPVTVGDRVKVQRSGSQDGVVEGICARKNQFTRAAPAREEQVIHVLAANIDRLVIVASIKDPPFSEGLLDRFLIGAQSSGIEPVICINKCDIRETQDEPWRLYSNLGIPCIPVSAKLKEGITHLNDLLLAKRSLFVGHSGVGKTSLLRALTGLEIGKIGELNEATLKGRHTTTSSVLYKHPDGTEWIDSPGVRSFGLAGFEAEDLCDFFPELARLACSQSGCLHDGEAFCQASSVERLASYRRIRESLAAGEY